MNVKDRKTMKTKFSKYGLDLIFFDTGIYEKDIPNE